MYYSVREVSGSLLVRESEGVKRKFHFQVTFKTKPKCGSLHLNSLFGRLKTEE